MSSLNFTCQPGTPGRLIWTPNDTTPDVVYYQVLYSATEWKNNGHTRVLNHLY